MLAHAPHGILVSSFLLARVKKFDLDKLIRTFVKVSPRLQSIARARTRCSATAEDLIQDAWLNLIKSQSGTVIEAPTGYVVRVANNTIIGHLRKEKRRSQIDSEINDLLWETTDEISPERVVIGRQNLRTVQAALDKMPEKTRRIFLMNRIDGIPHRRIADMFGITDEAVYYHIRRALERLAELRDELAN